MNIPVRKNTIEKITGAMKNVIGSSKTAPINCIVKPVSPVTVPTLESMSPRSTYPITGRKLSTKYDPSPRTILNITLTPDGIMLSRASPTFQ